jgi:hypothetical protein
MTRRSWTVLLVLATVGGVLLAFLSASALRRDQSPPPGSQVVLARVPDGGLQPQVAVDRQGVVHLIYFKGDPASGDVFYTTLTDGSNRPAPIRVNSQPGSVIATGNMRGAHLALGRDGRIHVSWMGSEKTKRNPKGGTPMLYSRSDPGGRAFEPQRNVAQLATYLDGGAVAADGAGNVYVAWHAVRSESESEGDRRLWVSRSTDDGATFAREEAASTAALGACGCCGVGALAGANRTLYLLYRSAREMTHRDAYLLTSKNAGESYDEVKLQDWNIGACPMSTFALTATRSGILAAWETAGQVQFVRIDPDSGTRSAVADAPGTVRTRKHPAIAGDASGNVLLVWTEDMGWSKGGALLWQVFDKDGKPTADHGRHDGVPAWSLVAAYARPAGGFTILY